MAWSIGALIGFLIGTAYQSLYVAIPLAILGGLIAKSITKKPEPSHHKNLEAKTQALQDQLNRLLARISTLEKKLQIDEGGSTNSANESAGTEKIPQTPQEEPVVATDQLHVHLDKTIAEQTISQKTPETLPELEHATTPSQTSKAKADTEKKTQKTYPARQPASSPIPSFLTKFIQRWVLGGNPLVKIGVLILFLGLAFLLRYASEHVVVPIPWRYAGVAVTGIALLVFGWRWRKRQDNYGLILQGTGIAILYLTPFAAMKLHPLIPVEFGFVILVTVAMFAVLLAVLQDSLALAVAATVGGFAVPVLASTGSGNHIGLFSYLTVLNLGITAVAWFKAWRLLNLIGYVCTFALGSAWAAKYYQAELFPATEGFLLLFFILYVLITLLFAKRTLAESSDHRNATFNEQIRQSAASVNYVDGSLAFGVPFSAFWLQYLLVKPFTYGAAYSALGFGLVYILLALALFKRTNTRYILLTETLIALGVVFGSLAIPLLDQPWTSAAWAVEAAGVYWIGIRQQRLHARFFALLLLLGSAIYFFPELRLSTQGTVLDGPLLNCILLTVSIGWTYWLMRKAAKPSKPQASDKPSLSRFETTLRPYLIAMGAFFLGTIPLLIFSAHWASTALALLGTAFLFFSLRLSERLLLHCGWIYQLIAGVLFMSTLHASEGTSVLSNGWAGLLASSLIGASILAGVGVIIRDSLTTAANPDDKTSPYPNWSTVGLIAGLTFINLAPLFILPWHLASMVWPLTGIATLFWALITRNLAAILFALGLQLIAGLVYFGSKVVGHRIPAEAAETIPAFLHSGFWAPILIALAAFTCARLLQRQKRELRLEISLGWIALAWAGLWWAFTWTNEIVRLVPAKAVPASLVFLALASVWSWSTLAKRWQWQELGLATLAYLPALLVIAIVAWLSGTGHPLSSWGIVAWPLALLIHILLLRRQTAWIPQPLLDLAHTTGAWLFIVQASVEMRWQFSNWFVTNSDIYQAIGHGNNYADYSTWPLLGWVLVPVLYLSLLSREQIQQRWPLRDHYQAYVEVSAIPIVIYSLAWVWVSSRLSNGTALPLPYVPLLNPLELSHLLVLLATATWWWQVLRHHATFGNTGPLAAGILGSTAFVIVTGGVIRASHHWGNVAWNANALFNSNLVQTSLSIVWSMLAIGLMLFGNRSKHRWVWISGAGLITVVVAKLFLVELAASGSLARIISFIVVGLLLLLVGYLAPLPPKKSASNSVISEPKTV